MINQSLHFTLPFYTASFNDFSTEVKTDFPIFISINNPDASVGVCCSHKVIAVGFDTLCYDAERGHKTSGINPSARINKTKYFHS